MARLEHLETAPRYAPPLTSLVDAGDAKRPSNPLLPGGASPARAPLLLRRPQSRPARLALSVAAVAAVVVATSLAQSASGYGTFMFAILGVAAVALISGVTHALLATALLGLFIDYVWMEPRFSLFVQSPGERVTIVAFVVAALLITAVVDAMRRFEARAHAHADALARSHERQAALTAEAERASTAAELASNAKTQFLTIMSHELRTPLNAILGYEELLYDGITGPVTEEQRAQLRRIKASTAHLLTLIGEILTLSRIEAGKETIAIEDVDVAQLLEEVGADARPLAGQKPIEVRVSNGALVIRTDRTKLKQVLLNLVSNAVKFTERGTVEAGSARDGDRILIRVRDSGIGISAEDVERIWEPFWQVHQAPRHRVGGTGLGLSLSRRLARLLGGEIRVDSELNMGSTFTLELPLVHAAHSAEVADIFPAEVASHASLQ